MALGEANIRFFSQNDSWNILLANRLTTVVQTTRFMHSTERPASLELQEYTYILNKISMLEMLSNHHNLMLTNEILTCSYASRTCFLHP